MTLKTINDFGVQSDCLHFPESRVNCAAILKKDLKREAIAWIKEINEKDIEIDNLEFNYEECRGATAFIKHFFCISESELL